MTSIISQIKLVRELTIAERASMYGLLSLEFLGTNMADFNRDLAEKEAVMLLHDRTAAGQIVGFSTLTCFELPIQNRRVRAVFSGDTTVLPEYRKTGGFGFEMGKYFLQKLRMYPDYEIYYVLISKGWRTYKVLPFFFNKFAPAWNDVTTDEQREVINSFGHYKYPKEYDHTSGCIIFSRETQRLAPGGCDAVPPPEPDPHVRHFLKINPTYLSGTELVCVGRVHPDNFAAPLKRLMRPYTQGKQ